MDVAISPEIEALIDRQIEKGRFTSPSEVVAEAVRSMELNDEYQEMQKFLALKAAMLQSQKSIEEGAHSDIEEVRARLAEKHNLNLGSA